LTLTSSFSQAGQNKVEIEGLPSTIDTHTVRVSGLGDARLSDVVCTIETNSESSYAPDSSSELIRLLDVQKQALESEKRIRKEEAELLVKYAQTLTGEHVSPTNMSTFLENFIEQNRVNLKAVIIDYFSFCSSIYDIIAFIRLVNWTRRSSLLNVRLRRKTTRLHLGLEKPEAKSISSSGPMSLPRSTSNSPTVRVSFPFVNLIE
jgi:hypothetical protein